MAFMRTGLIIAALLVAWVAFRTEGFAHVAPPAPMPAAAAQTAP